MKMNKKGGIGMKLVIFGILLIVMVPIVSSVVTSIMGEAIDVPTDTSEFITLINGTPIFLDDTPVDEIINFTGGNVGTYGWKIDDIALAGSYSMGARKRITEVEKSLSTINYTDIMFEFYAFKANFTAEDSLNVSYWNGASYVSVLDSTGDSAYTRYNYTLGVDAEDNADFKILFRCETGQDATCQIDNVTIEGVPTD